MYTFRFCKWLQVFVFSFEVILTSEAWLFPIGLFCSWWTNFQICSYLLLRFEFKALSKGVPKTLWSWWFVSRELSNLWFWTWHVALSLILACLCKCIQQFAIFPSIFWPQRSRVIAWVMKKTWFRKMLGNHFCWTLSLFIYIANLLLQKLGVIVLL